MDNITHTLIGIALGEGVAVVRKKERKKIWIASAIANNLPDLDVLLSTIFFKDKLGYLLQHRGHTHTFLLAPLQSIMLLLLLRFFWKKEKDVPWAEVVFVSFLGTFTHILADYCNSYGIHPYWPWDNKWIYGDLIFIVEPWIWILLIPPLYVSAQKIGKKIFSLLFISILIAAWVFPIVPAEMATSLTIGALFSFSYSRAKESWRISIALLSLFALLAFFYFSKQKINSFLEEDKQNITLTPMPANPFCWSGISSKIAGQEYIANVYKIAPFPKIFSLKKCEAMHAKEYTASLHFEKKEQNKNVEKIGVFRGNFSELKNISKNCSVNAFLRFARNPFWEKVGDKLIIGDLRFDRSKDHGFSELIIERDSLCPKMVPPWIGNFHPENFN